MTSMPLRSTSLSFSDQALFRRALQARWNRWIEIERDARSAYALIPLGMMVGIAVPLAYGFRPAGWLALLVVVAAALVSRLLAGRAIAGLALFLGSVGFGAAVLEWELSRTSTVILSGDATVRITGPVLEREEDERGRFRYTVRIDATERPTLSRPPGQARILVSSRHEPLAIGQVYKGLVRLRPPAGPAYPDGYDFAFAPYFKGLGAYGFSLGAPEAGTPQMDLGWRSAIADLRLRMDERIRAVLPGAEGAVASALITGLRGAVPDAVEESFRITGLAHVLSISGFHMALVAGFVMAMVRSVLALVPPLALHLPAKKIAAVFALAASGFYYLLSGDNAATERSFVMIAVMLGAVLVDRPAITLRNVGFAAIVVLAASPHVVLTATFQMSFAATVALVGLYGALTRARAGRGASDRSVLAGIGMVLLGLAVSSLIAGAATAPYSIYHFQRAAPYGLIANIAATPVFTFWVMPAGLASALAMPFGWEEPFLALMGTGLSIVFEMAGVFASMFPDVATGPISDRSLVLFSAAILCASIFPSALRWAGLPLIAAGLLAAPVPHRPELIVFEDGKEIALLFPSSPQVDLRERPNRFVADQWDRAFPDLRNTGEPGAFECRDSICRVTTASGQRVAWTDDYTLLGAVCDTADIAIVARAVRTTECLSKATLVTLRTLRRTGSLTFSSAEDGALQVRSSIPERPQEWNRHRHAPWPEAWRRGEPAEASVGSVSDSAGSGPPAAPAP